MHISMALKVTFHREKELGGGGGGGCGYNKKEKGSTGFI